MLEKDKICIEFSMRSMMLTHRPYQEDTEIAITGMVPGREKLTEPNPFDIPCDVVMVPKKEFERLQAKVSFSEELAKQWEENYNLLLKKTGFDTTESLIFYLTNVGQYDTLLEALANLRDSTKYASDEWAKTVLKLTECEKENIDLKKENDEYARKNQDLIDDSCGRKMVIDGYKRDIERWKEATGCPSPFAAKDWVHNLGEANGSLAKAIISWQKATCCSTPEEAKELIGNKNGGIVELKNKLDTSLTANEQLKEKYETFRNALKEWKEATGCPSPSAAKTLIESGASWMSAYHSSCEVIKTWKKLTGCPTPIAAKTLIESAMTYEHGYHEVQEENRKLTDEVESWKHVTGYSTPEDFLSAKINKVVKEVSSWEEITGFSTPEKCSFYIDTLEKKLEDIKDLIEED